MKQLTVLLSSIILTASTMHSSPDDPRHRTGLDLDFNGDVYSIGLNYHYMVCPYVGLGGAIGLWRQTGSDGLLGDLTYDDGWEWDYGYGYYDDYEVGPTAFYFQPSAVILTPNFWTGNNLALGMTFKPWVRFSTNYHFTSNINLNGNYRELDYKCRNITFGGNIGPTFYVGPVAITAGYQISTLDCYRDYHITSSGHVTYTTKINQGGFIEISGTF